LQTLERNGYLMVGTQAVRRRARGFVRPRQVREFHVDGGDITRDREEKAALVPKR